MPVKKLKEFLDNHHVKYICIAHAPAFTSQEIAAAAHVSGRALAKTVLVKVNQQLVMIVLASNDQVNFNKLKKALGTAQISLATESDFKDKFPGCEVGAMPPFGNLYDMPVYMVSGMQHHDHIVFNAGSHAELVQIAFHDFERLVKPKMLSAYA